MGRTCINDHRPEHSMGDERWLTRCAQCEVERLAKALAECSGALQTVEREAALWEERARHLGWKDGHAA